MSECFERAAEPEAPAPERQAAYVLVVDDEEGVRGVLARLIERMGMQPLSAPDGPAGVALFAAHASQIVCVLIDMRMPGMSGAQTLAQIRAIHASIPAVLMSGDSAADEEEQVGDALVTFLSKPFGLADLRARISSAARLAT